MELIDSELHVAEPISCDVNMSHSPRYITMNEVLRVPKWGGERVN